MFKFNLKIRFLISHKNKNYKRLKLSNSIQYTSFFYNIDFPILISCRQIVKKNLRNIYGQFYIGPFFVGQGLTVANALRRTLLSELSTIAITSVSIQNVVHQYQTIQGLEESVFDLLMNIKEIVFSSNQVSKFPQIGYLQVQGPCVIKAKDLLLPSFIQCVDPDQYIATLANDGFLKLKFVLRQGKSSIVHTNLGFDSNSLINQSYSKTIGSPNLPNENNAIDAFSLLNTYSKPLIIDPSFNPILKVNYIIELLDFDKLSSERKNSILEPNNLNFYQKDKNNFITKEVVILEIWTNGSISPVIALKKSVQKLIRIFLKLQNSKLLNKINSNTSTKSYINIFEKLNNQYNFLKYKQSQTLSDFKGGSTTDGHFSEISFIEQLKYLINQLE